MDTEPLSPQDALVAVMIATSAADENMSAVEFQEINSIVGILPVFAGYDIDRVGPRRLKRSV